MLMPSRCRWEVPRWSKDAAASAAGGEVVTPMPGRLVKLFVAEGQAVVKGQALLVLEAMKMEHVVNAPCDGLVTGLEAGVGSQVEEGQVLLHVTAEAAAGGTTSGVSAAAASA